MTKEYVAEELILKIEEGLTANVVQQLNKDVNAYFEESEGFKTLVLNLNNTENIDSVGVTFVIGLYKKMKSDKKLFRVTGASDDVQSLFKLMKLDQFFEMTR